MTATSDDSNHSRSAARKANSFELFQRFPEEAMAATNANLEVWESGADRLAEFSRDVFKTAGEESLSYVSTVMDVAKSNASFAAALAIDIAKARTPSDFVAITNAHANKQLDLVTAQNRKLWASASKLTSAWVLSRD